MICAWTSSARSATRPRSCDQAYALVVDPEFRAAVCDATHAIDYNVEIEEHDDGGAHIVVDRTVPADVPDMMKKFVGETIGVKQTEDWGPPGADGSRTADLLLEIKGQPAKLAGTITLAPNGDGCHEVVDGELSGVDPVLRQEDRARDRQGHQGRHPRRGEDRTNLARTLARIARHAEIRRVGARFCRNRLAPWSYE